MSIKNLLRTMAFLVLLGLIGCASSMPQGAKKIGRYEGTFRGQQIFGVCKIDLYQLLDGSESFEGKFMPTNKNPKMRVIGEKTGKSLEGTLSGVGLLAGSTIKGILSDDKSIINGTFSLNMLNRQKGTWKATIK